MAGAVVLTLALVAFGNLVNLLPQRLDDRLYVSLNLTVGALAGVIAAWWLGLDGQRLGLALDSVVPGLRWGAATGLALGAPPLLALAVPSLRRRLADTRVESLDARAIGYRALVRIPLGTALFEEWVFRGVLYGAWLQAAGLTGAFVGSSVAFGLWHILPSVKMLRANRRDAPPSLVALFIVGGVVATGVGGAMFAALRYWTGGILAPTLAHGLINSLALVVTYMAGRR